MFQVKLNGNYNVIIKDVGAYLSPSATDSVTLDDTTFNTSNDIKKLLAAGIIVAVQVDTNTANTDKVAEAVTEVTSDVLTDGTAFVRDGRTVENPDDVFIATPVGIGERQLPELPLQEAVDVKDTETTEATEIETKVETEPVVETEVENEVVEPVVEESKTENKAATKKAKIEKPVKKNNK